MASNPEKGARNGFVAFATKVGIITGAIVGVGLAFKALMGPISFEIQRQVTEERIARVQADDKIIDGLKQNTDALGRIAAHAAVFPRVLRIAVRDTVHVVTTPRRSAWNQPRLYGR